MPILERDPWRYQFFVNIPCPAHVSIPTDDPDCWELFPQHRWVYDKLKIAESQGLPCGPHGVTPSTFPVFSKPIVNLKGMGVGSRPIVSLADYERHYAPGHMWMEHLSGEHVSTDCAVEAGQIVWCRHATGLPMPGGTFQHWIIHAEERPGLQTYLADWTGRHMPSYSGMMNFETIGGRIIEAHLRFADQWCDLYGNGWIEALIQLYESGRWSFRDDDRRTGYSVPLFALHGAGYHHPPGHIQDRIRSMPGVRSLQITFHEQKDAAEHAMPPGGFRLAIVNSWDLGSAQAARQRLAEHFGLANVTLPG